jgi:hypothetical protein
MSVLAHEGHLAWCACSARQEPRDAVDVDVCSPKHHASQHGHAEVVRSLCEAAAPKDAVDAFGASLMHSAAHTRDTLRWCACLAMQELNRCSRCVWVHSQACCSSARPP